ncbi:MAG: hypothetical protein JXA73_03235 [Acidobacteria bacterium]|nr:hypothetical protein [Acidobacteriota bacterium]
MEKFELSKTIEAGKLNKRTGIPLAGPPTTIPFGAIVENPVADRDVVKFTYLNEPYQCSEETFREAASSIMHASTPAPKQAERSAGKRQPRLNWEVVDTNMGPLYRAKAPGGWLIAAKSMSTLAFCPDPHHAWDLLAPQ